MKKIISLILIFSILNVFFINTKSYAEGTTDSGVSEVIEAMRETSNPANMENSNINTKNVINSIIGILQFVGSGISIIVITIMGLKYLLAAPSEKAEVKKMAIPIVIGCVLLFGAINLVGAIEEFTSVLKTS